MLAPDDRQLLVESLAPPLGTRFDAAIATTFTLDLEALLIPALAFSAGAATDAGGDPLAILEALRRTSDRIDVFAQTGAIAVPKKGEDLFAFLEPMVHQVRKPRGGLFHPKVWAVRYLDKITDAPSYRVLVLSRNLTLDNSWDVAVRLDSERIAPDDQPENEPLSGLLSSLPNQTVIPIDGARRTRIEALADEIRKVVWECPDGLNGPTFHHLRPDAPHGIDLDGRRHLIISPFVNDEGLAMFAQSPQLTVVSRVDELEKLSPVVAESLDAYVLDVSQFDAPDPAAPERNLLGQLHAKAYVIEPRGRAQRARILLGSVNATHMAFTRNIEFLVEFEGRRRALGVETMLGADAPFRQMVRAYQPSGGQVPTAAEELQQAMERVLCTIAEIVHTIRVHNGSEGTHSLRLRAAEPYRLPAEWDLSVELLTRAGVAHRPVAGRLLDVIVDGVATADITPFVSIHLHSGETTVSTVVVATIENDPADRLDEILARQFDDPEKFHRFLLMMLSPGEFDFAAAALAGARDGRRAANSSVHADSAVLDLVLARLAEGSTSLGELGSLVDRLRSTEQGRKAFPEGFLDLWAEVERAMRTLNEGSR